MVNLTVPLSCSVGGGLVLGVLGSNLQAEVFCKVNPPFMFISSQTAGATIVGSTAPTLIGINLLGSFSKPINTSK
eukprot:Pgem_evm1s14313